VNINLTSLCSFLILFFIISCEREGIEPMKGTFQLVSATVGGISILDEDASVPVNNEIVLLFNTSIDPATNGAISLEKSGDPVNVTISNLDQNKIINVRLGGDLEEAAMYTLTISNELKAENETTFPGISIDFEIQKATLRLIAVSLGDMELSKTSRNINIPVSPEFTIEFSHSIPTNILQEEIVLVGNKNYAFTIEETEEKKYLLKATDNLDGFSKSNLLLPSSIGTLVNRPFESVSYELFTDVDPTPKFPEISDEELLTLIQSQTFKYFWDFGHPVSGLARERNTSGDIVTMGGTGFGLMAMIVAVERGFITKEEAIDRWEKMFSFLKDADRFHGVWPHWMNGVTGATVPFSQYDNGGDLVETAFLIQGMLTVRQYLNADNEREGVLIEMINELWESVEWDWYTKGGENVLYWHWSENFGWRMNLPIRGHNETQIIYVLAAAAPTHTINKEVYDQGYARSGNMVNGNSYYGYELPLGGALGGPLFFSHYSYLGLDPRNLEDQYANYWTQNVNHSLINQAYCIDNPLNYVGYSEQCWGLTASDNDQGYSAHSPTNDRGVITPTAAISSIPYTPEESLKAIRFFYYILGDKLWGEYGFYDAFNPTANWYASSFLAIDQGPIICMIENYRTGLLWDLFMSAPEVKTGLEKLGFTY
jgi:hypothetical protein